MQLRITDAHKTRVRKVHNNGDNGLARQVPQKRAGGRWKTNMQQIVAWERYVELSSTWLSIYAYSMRHVPRRPHLGRPVCGYSTDYCERQYSLGSLYSPSRQTKSERRLLFHTLKGATNRTPILRMVEEGTTYYLHTPELYGEVYSADP